MWSQHRVWKDVQTKSLPTYVCRWRAKLLDLPRELDLELRCGALLTERNAARAHLADFRESLFLHSCGRSCNDGHCRAQTRNRHHSIRQLHGTILAGRAGQELPHGLRVESHTLSS